MRPNGELVDTPDSRDLILLYLYVTPVHSSNGTAPEPAPLTDSSPLPLITASPFLSLQPLQWLRAPGEPQ